MYGQYVTNPKPNWYTESYDVITLTRSCFGVVPKNKTIRKVMAWIENVDVATIEPFEKIWPDVKTLEEKYAHVSPLAILESAELMGDYLNVPPEGSVIAVLGEVEKSEEESSSLSE